MTVLSKVLAAGALVVTGIAGAIVVRRHRIGRRSVGGRSTAVAGSMFVGAVDEVELGRVGAGENPESFDSEEIPSEHQEMNDLRGKMPFG